MAELNHGNIALSTVTSTLQSSSLTKKTDTQVKKTEVATVLQNLHTLYLRVPEYWTQTTCTLCTSLLAGQHVSRLANTDSQSQSQKQRKPQVINGKNENANFKMTHNVRGLMSLLY